MSNRAILALDQGTTGTTALVVGSDGRILGRGYSEFHQSFPRAGWVEHDPLEIWEVTRKVARLALGEARRSHGVEPEAVGIANQRETLVVWERATGRPVHRAIVWQDRRSTEICRSLKEAGLEPEFRRRTGLVLDPYFTGTKLTWLFRNDSGLRARAEAGELAAGTVDSWLLWQATDGAVHATDPTNASRTLLYDLATGDWSPELADALELPRPELLLPKILPSSGLFGVALGEAFGVEAPVTGVAGDQQAALFGQGCWASGLAKNTYGTGAFLLLHTGDVPVVSRHGLLTTVACDARGGRAFALEGSIFIAGAAIQWLRDGLGLLARASESDAMARQLTGNDGVYFVPALVGLGAPHWEPDVRGTITGLTRGTTKAHLVRAALEAMAYGTADVLAAMEADSGVRTTELRVDGGAAANDWLMAFQAGLLGITVRRPALVETTAMGAAGLAGLAVGVWDSADTFLAAPGAPRRFSPELSEKARTTLKAGWARAVGAARSLVPNPLQDPV